MDCYLIVANQTLGGAELEDAIQRRIEGGHGNFHIIVPIIAPALESTAWAGLEAGTVAIPTAEEMDEARRRSEQRLADLVERIRSAGGTATGEIGDENPARAVKEALERSSFDEVIVSTLPAGISRWLKMDLPSRIDRMVDIPVTTVEADS